MRLLEGCDQMNTSEVTPTDLPSNNSFTRDDKAYSYLRKKAIRAHDAHDGIYVLHLVHTALETIKNRQNPLPLADVRWCFYLALYWCIEDSTVTLVKDALKKVTGNLDDRRVIGSILNFLDNPCRSSEQKNFELPTQDWIKERSVDCEDKAIQCLFIELLWWRSPTSDHFWSDVLLKWQHALNLLPFAMVIEELANRLRFQSAILFGYAPKPGQALPDHVLAKIFCAFYECRWAELDSLIKSFAGKTQVEKSEYLSLFGFIQYSRTYRNIASQRNEHSESQTVDLSEGRACEIVKPMVKPQKPVETHDTYSQSLSRYYLCASRQVSHAHMRQQVENLQDAAIRSVNRKAQNSHDLHDARLGMFGEIRALRAWDLVSLIDIVALRSDIELTSGSKGNHSMAAAGICDALRSTRTPDPEKDTRIEKVVECIDSGNAELRDLVTQAIVKSPPLEWPCAYRWISMLTDVIDDVGLLQVAKWIQGPEGRNDLPGWRLSYLEFWKDVLPYVSTAPAISDVLCSSFVNAASLPIRWSTDEDTLVAAIEYGSSRTSDAIILALQTATQLDAMAKEQRWRILFRACSDRPDLLSQVRNWLNSNIPTKYCQHFIKRLDNVKNDGPIDDSDFRTWLIKRLEDLTAKLNRPRGSTVSFGDEVNGRIFRLVTWTVEHKLLFDGLISAIDAKDGNSFSKAAGLMVLTSVVEVGDSAIVDTVLAGCQNWVSLGHIPAIDPWGPLRTDDEMDGKPLERELWLLIYVCTQKRPNQMRSPTWKAALNGNCQRSSDIVFATLVLLALSAPDDPSSLAMITFTECLIIKTDDKQLSRFVRTFAMFLKTHEESDDLAPISLTNVPARMLLEFWTRHLAILAKNPRFDVRFEVAQAIKAWRDNEILIFPQELREAQKSLANDARARVRWAVRQCKEFQSELG